MGAAKVNCFTAGTLIATPRGATAIEALAPGDVVLTRDNGAQEIRWVGQRQLSGPALRVDRDLHPVLIRAGSLGPGVPERDLQLSPNHRVLLLGDHPSLDVAEAEVFVSAHHLVGTRGIASVAVSEVSYFHFMCDRHEVVLSNGAWTESFRPSAAALQGVSDRARDELFAIFPELADRLREVQIAPARATFRPYHGGKLRA
ncbi:MAG: Hint domain-containing protein [Maritimibacter sp.]|nr:Hint domain-containing protein [Maritimibacter sp.]